MSRKLTDNELATFLGIAGHPKAGAIIASISTAKRALYDRMAASAAEVETRRRRARKPRKDRRR